MKDKPNFYDVITSGTGGYKLWKRGNKKATRVYNNGLEMRDSVAYYLISRQCEITIHHPDATVWRILKSNKINPRYY